MIGVLLEQVTKQRNLPQNRHAGLDLVGPILDQAAEYGGAARLDDDVGSDIALRYDGREIALLRRFGCLADFLIDVEENRIVGPDARRDLEDDACVLGLDLLGENDRLRGIVRLGLRLAGDSKRNLVADDEPRRFAVHDCQIRR